MASEVQHADDQCDEAVVECLRDTLAVLTKCGGSVRGHNPGPREVEKNIEWVLAMMAIPIAIKHGVSHSIVTNIAHACVRGQSEGGWFTVDALKNALAARLFELAKRKGGGDGE